MGYILHIDMIKVLRSWNCHNIVKFITLVTTSWLCDKFNSHVLLPLPWPKFRFWLCDKFNSHVLPPLPWPKFRFWLCDKFNSHVLPTLPWPKFRFWLCDKFNSHVFLPLPWPKFRFWLCDKFNSHVLPPHFFPYLDFVTVLFHHARAYNFVDSSRVSCSHFFHGSHNSCCP